MKLPLRQHSAPSHASPLTLQSELICQGRQGTDVQTDEKSKRSGTGGKGQKQSSPPFMKLYIAGVHAALILKAFLHISDLSRNGAKHLDIMATRLPIFLNYPVK